MTTTPADLIFGICEPKPFANAPKDCRVKLRMRGDCVVKAIVYDPKTKLARWAYVTDAGDKWELDFS